MTKKQNPADRPYWESDWKPIDTFASLLPPCGTRCFFEVKEEFSQNSIRYFYGRNPKGKGFVVPDLYPNLRVPLFNLSRYRVARVPPEMRAHMNEWDLLR